MLMGCNIDMASYNYALQNKERPLKKKHAKQMEEEAFVNDRLVLL